MRSNRDAEIIGKRFGRLLALSYERTAMPGWHREFNCACSCGTAVIVRRRSLIDGLTKSCGCLARSTAATTIRNIRLRHGKTKTHIYRTWAGMRSRCYNPKNKSFARYGGRGIDVCARWRESFENFLADMGEPPTAKHSIDRIDNSKGYSPRNCRWATSTQQVRNRRCARTISIDGEKLSFAEAAERYSLKIGTINYRVSRGWTPRQCVGLDPHEREWRNQWTGPA